MRVVGIVLIVLGVLGLAYGGISWTYKDKVADFGPIEITKEKTERLPLSPVMGGISLVAGIFLVMSSGRTRHA